MPIKLNTDEQAAANIKAIDENAWTPYNAAARYVLEQKKDYDDGPRRSSRSRSRSRRTGSTSWTKAQLLAAKGKYKDAYPLAEKAQELGEKARALLLRRRREEGARRLEGSK